MNNTPFLIVTRDEYDALEATNELIPGVLYIIEEEDL
jgi:hypothetical protein